MPASKNLVSHFFIAYYCTALVTLSSLAAPVQPCTIGPGKGGPTEITIQCTLGESETQIDASSGRNFQSDASYHLTFKNTLFNKARIVHIQDSITSQEIFTITVKAPQQVTMQSLIDDKTWILEDLSKAELAELEIEIEGTLIFTDALEIQTSLLLTAPHLYLLQPFSVKDGTFDIRYQNGIISQLNFLFESKIEDGYIVLNSVSAVQAPSHRQISIKMLPRVEFQVPISDLLRAYAQAFPDRDRIEERAAFLAKTTDQEKLDYLRQHIFLPITNNTAKEIIGETLYRLHMTRTQPNFQFYNAKVGRHSFDAVHIELPAVRHPNILISEVKYAKEGKPILKFITLENKQWKQLSLPYVKNKLETMLLHTSETQTLAQSIQAHPKAQVELRLAVFNPHEFKLVVYQVGTLERSALD